MRLDIRDILENTIDRVMTPAAGWLVAGFFVLGLLNQAISTSFATAMIERQTNVAINTATTLSLGISSLPVLGVLTVLMMLVGTWYTIVAGRVFLNERTESIPLQYVTDAIPRRLGHLVAGGLVSTLLIFAGGVLLIVPGIYVMLGLLFFPVIVIDTEKGFIQAFRHSWEIVAGHRWRLFGLGIVVTVLAMALSVAGTQIGSLLSPVAPSASAIIQTLMTGIGSVFQWAALVETYRRLNDVS